MPAVLCMYAVLCHHSGTVVRTGPGKYDKEAEGGRKALVVKEGDKVRVEWVGVGAAAAGLWLVNKESTGNMYMQ